MLLAMTRGISRRMGECELSYQERQPIDIGLARAQHNRYEECLAALGCQIIRLREEPDLPDSVFVEDAAIVLDELAIITRPGAESRRRETSSIDLALRPYRRMVHIEPPGILDGGDVLRIGKRLYIGLSRRTNEDAIRQLRILLDQENYSLSVIPVQGCLHLKSAVTWLGGDTLLINHNWVNAAAFGDMRRVEVAGGEPCAANAISIDGKVVFPAEYPATRSILESRGIEVYPIDVSEIIKAEGGVTCCSLLFSV